MSLSREQREKLTEQYMQKYFPTATPIQVDWVRNFAAVQFMGDYSTIPKENDHPRTAIRSGQTLEQFVIYHGWNQTDQLPLNVSLETLGIIIKLGGM